MDKHMKHHIQDLMQMMIEDRVKYDSTTSLILALPEDVDDKPNIIPVSMPDDKSLSKMPAAEP